MTTKSPFISNLRIASKQRGVSLPLLAIFIGVAVLFIIPALIYGPRYFTKTKVQNEVAALSDLRSNIVSYGSRVGLFTSTNASLVALVAQNFFPASMVSGTAAAPVVTNQWGGAITVGIGTIVTAGDSIVVTETGIPATACTEFGTSIDSVSSVIVINGTTTKASGGVTNPGTVGTSCGGAAGDDNTIAMTLAK